MRRRSEWSAREVSLPGQEGQQILVHGPGELAVSVHGVLADPVAQPGARWYSSACHGTASDVTNH